MPPLDPKTTMSAGARPKQSSQRRSQGHRGALEHPQLASEQVFLGQTAPNMRGAAWRENRSFVLRLLIGASFPGFRTVESPQTLAQAPMAGYTHARHLCDRRAEAMHAAKTRDHALQRAAPPKRPYAPRGPRS